MPSIDDVYGSDETLRASHLPVNQSVPVVIEQVTPKRFDDGGKLELKFVGKQRVLLCNKTNAATIARYLRTTDYTRWEGQTIHLKATETEFRGEMVPCVRVDTRPPHVQPQAAGAAPTPQPLAPAPPTGELTYVPDNPSDPGGYRSEAAALAASPDPADVPF